MANALGTGTHKRKETYANEVLAIARAETNIYEDFSTDYEKDEVTGQINVPTRNGEVKVSDYDILNGIELTQSATDYLPLPIDKDYGINELIDGYEAEAVPDNLVAQRIESAGYSLGLKKENMAIEELKKGTVSDDTTPLTEADAYKKIATEIKNMKERNMKVSSMRVVVSADTELLLLTDEKFSNTAGTLGAELVREGVIGKINGVPVKPNYLMGEDIEFIIYDKRFCQKYEVWKKEPSVEDIKDGKHVGASALQGRQVGGLMVTNKLGVQIKKKSRVIDPEITGLTITPQEGLQEGNANVNANAVVATLSAEGGTGPFTYTLETDEVNGADNTSFKIDGTNVKVNTTPLTQKDYKINIKVTDSKGKTFTNHTTISVIAAAG